MVALTFPNIPASYSPQNEETVRNQVVQFGDGYDLVVGDGLNTLRATKSVSWDALTYPQMSQIVSFLRSHKDGRWFYYHLDEDPGRPRKFLCERWAWSKVPDSLHYWKVTAEFKEVFRTER